MVTLQGTLLDKVDGILQLRKNTHCAHLCLLVHSGAFKLGHVTPAALSPAVGTHSQYKTIHPQHTALQHKATESLLSGEHSTCS
eukprot:5873569-Amphidinium_carterae.1